MELNEITCLKATSYRFWLLIAVTFLYTYLTKEFERTSYRALGHSFMKGTICNDFPIFQCSNSTCSQTLSKLWPIETDTISQVMSQDVSSVFPFTVPMERRSLLKLDEGGGNFSKWNEEPVSKTTQKFVVQLLKSCPTLQAHGLQHARLSFHSLSPGVCSDSYSLSQRWYLTISSSVALFSSCPQSFPASGSFPMSWLFSSGGQSIVLELQHQSFQWILRVHFLKDSLVWSPCSPRDSQESSPGPKILTQFIWPKWYILWKSVYDTDRRHWEPCYTDPLERV